MKFFSKSLRDIPFVKIVISVVMVVVVSIVIGIGIVYAVTLVTVTDSFDDQTKIAGLVDVTISGGQAKLSATAWTCGSTFTDLRDSQVYTTVLIGTQCWMAQNLNVGTRIAGASNQGIDCNSIQKYCYADSDANCTSNVSNNTDGGLYQWNQMMCGGTSCNGTGSGQPACTAPVQGICPTGWHIPSHYEWTLLELSVCDSASCATDFPYDTTTTNWRGTNEGTKLKSGGASGFMGLLAGYRSTNGSFFNLGAYTNLWSSLESGGSAWRRYLYSGFVSVYRETGDKTFGFSVRCLKD